MNYACARMSLWLFCLLGSATIPAWGSVIVSVEVNKLTDKDQKKSDDMSQYIFTLKTESRSQLFNPQISSQNLFFETLQLLINDGFEFTLSTIRSDNDEYNVYEQVIDKINGLNDGGIAPIKKYMIQNSRAKDTDNTDMIKQILKNALKDFELKLEQNIIGNYKPQKGTASERDKDIRDLKNIIDNTEFTQPNIKKNIKEKIDTLQKKLIKQGHFSPPMDLFDNKSPLVAPYRIVYYEIEKLGKFFGFTCAPIDSTWSQWVSHQAWRHKGKLLLLGLGALGIAAYSSGMLNIQLPSLQFPSFVKNPAPTSPVKPLAPVNVTPASPVPMPPIQESIVTLPLSTTLPEF